MIHVSKENLLAWPRHRTFTAVGSASERLRFCVFRPFCRNNSQTLEISTRGPASSLKIFCEKALNFSQNLPAVQRSRFKKISKENLLVDASEGSKDL